MEAVHETININGNGYHGDVNRAILFKELGDAERVLRLVHLPKPKVMPTYLLVRIVLRPIHHFDFLLCSDEEVAHNFYHFEEQNPLVNVLKTSGIVPGLEGGLGIVEEIGEGVTICSPGQRLHLSLIHPHFRGPSFQGSWQDYVLLKEQDAILVPDNIEDEVAAQFSANPWTAYGLCKDIESICPKGEYILITAAASILGRVWQQITNYFSSEVLRVTFINSVVRLFIQLASNLGYKVIAVVRREELKDDLLALGASAVINNVGEDVAKVVKHITGGKGAYLGLDLVAGASTKIVGASVRDGGQVLVVGELGTTDIVFSQKDMWRNVQFSYWDAVPYFWEKEKREAAIETCWKLFGEGVWKLPPAKRIDLADFKVALNEARVKSSTTGKVLLESR